MENEKQMITINCYFTAENVSTAGDTLNCKSYLVEEHHSITILLLLHN